MLSLCEQKADLRYEISDLRLKFARKGEIASLIRYQVVLIKLLFFPAHTSPPAPLLEKRRGVTKRNFISIYFPRSIDELYNSNEVKKIDMH
jgi:hypothetical protein